MALATRCPHCNTTFRVASDQLKLRGGIVRCGSCHEIFDGNKSLFDPDAVIEAEAAPEAQLAPAPAPQAVPLPLPPGDFKYEPDPGFDAEPAPLPFNGYVDFPLDLIDEEVEAAPPPQEEKAPPAPAIAHYTAPEIDLHSPWEEAVREAESELQQASAEPEAVEEAGAALDPQQVRADASADRPYYYEDEGYYDDPPDYYDDPPDYYDDPPEPAPLRAADAEAFSQPPVDELFNSVMPDLEHGPLPLLREAAHDDPAPVARIPEPRPPKSKKKKPVARAPHTIIAHVPEPVPEHDEPAFVRRSREQEESGRTRRLAMIAGSVLLGIALLAQGTTTFRNVLVASMPSLKGPIGGVCAVFGCRIELPAEIDMLTVETGELNTVSANNFSLTTLLRNQSGLIQSWPHIELALTDSNDKVLLRRVIAPADYLPKGTLVSKGFAAHNEQPVKLLFEVSQIKASGYRIAIFYP